MKKGELIKKYATVVKVKNERATVIEIDGFRYNLDLKNSVKGR